MRSNITDKLLPSSRYEDEAARRGYAHIAGIDEAGRGPLAGPVVAAAVVLSFPDIPRGLNDSKLLSARVREKLAYEIGEKAVAVGIGIVPPEIIDQINILQATRQAMSLAVKNMLPQPDYLLIDGPISLDLDFPQEAIVKGDRLSLSVAAAGIVAKVTRDKIMLDLHEKYPLYGFDRHKGYPTQGHRQAILTYGPCLAHRKSFRGVVEFF